MLNTVIATAWLTYSFSIGALVGRQETTFSFSNLDSGEVDLFMRYLSLRRIDAPIITSSLELRMLMPVSNRKLRELLSDYKGEYGVDLNARATDGKLSLPFVRYVVRPNVPLTPTRFWKHYNSNSLLQKAYKQLVSKRVVGGSEMLESCTFVLRPWISHDLQQTEAAMGTFVLIKSGKSSSVQFLVWN